MLPKCKINVIRKSRLNKKLMFYPKVTYKLKKAINYV